MRVLYEAPDLYMDAMTRNTMEPKSNDPHKKDTITERYSGNKFATDKSGMYAELEHRPRKRYPGKINESLCVYADAIKSEHPKMKNAYNMRKVRRGPNLSKNSPENKGAIKPAMDAAEYTQLNFNVCSLHPGASGQWD